MSLSERKCRGGYNTHRYDGGCGRGHAVLLKRMG